MEHSDIYTSVLAKAYASCTDIEHLKSVSDVIETLDKDVFKRIQICIKQEMEAKLPEDRLDQLFKFGKIPLKSFHFDGGLKFFNTITDITPFKQHRYQKLMISTSLEYLWRNPLCGEYMGKNCVKENKLASKLYKLSWFYSSYFRLDLNVSDLIDRFNHPNMAPFKFFVNTHEELIDAFNKPIYYGNGTIYYKKRLDSKPWQELDKEGVLARFVIKYTRAMKRKLGYLDRILETAQTRPIIEQAQIIWWLEFSNTWSWLTGHYTPDQEEELDSDCEDLRHYTFQHPAIYEF